MNEYNLLCAIGDIHGDYFVISHFLKGNELENVCIICVGDFPRGLGNDGDIKEEEEKLKLLNEFLVEKKSKLFVVRGNHDNPSFYKGKNDFSNIIFVQDYSVLKINNKNILCIGGAISIDRKRNKINIDWFKDEELVIDYNSIKDLTNLDIVITHTAPDFAYPFYNKSDLIDNYSLTDPTLYEELEKERKSLGELVDFLINKNKNLTQYFYGHFHKSYTTYKGNMKLICLAPQEVSEIR